MSDLKLCFHFPVSKDSQVQVRSSSGYLTDEEIEKTYTNAVGSSH